MENGRNILMKKRQLSNLLLFNFFKLNEWQVFTQEVSLLGSDFDKTILWWTHLSFHWTRYCLACHKLCHNSRDVYCEMLQKLSIMQIMSLIYLSRKINWKYTSYYIVPVRVWLILDCSLFLSHKSSQVEKDFLKFPSLFCQDSFMTDFLNTCGIFEKTFCTSRER